MADAIYAFSKASDKSTVASGRLAEFISDRLKLPLHHDASINDYKSLRILYIVNGPPLYALGHMEALASAIVKAKLVVWVQNDYTTPTPVRRSSDVKSPYWRAFGIRGERNLPLIAWSTVRDRQPEGSVYTNWNLLTYEDRVIKPCGDHRKELLYYGAYRKGREEGFIKYLMTPRGVKHDVTISSTSSKFQELIDGLGVGYHTHVIEPFRRSVFFETLASYGFGMYLEDKQSHVEYHSPPNRFYEMLSAGLPMLFQEETGIAFAEEGFDISDFVVSGPRDIAAMFKFRAEHLKKQKKWRRDYLSELSAQMKKAHHQILSRF